MVKNQKIVVVVNKAQKKQIQMLGKLLGYDNMSDFIRNSLTERNFLIFEFLRKIHDTLEGMKNEQTA